MSDSEIKTDEKGKERREYFRLKYQIGDRPRLKIEGGKGYDIVDISEHGIRFYFTGGDVENPVRAVIEFPELSGIDIEGTIRRIENNEICLEIEDAIPMKTLLVEQRRLFKKYGKVMEGDEH